MLAFRAPALMEWHLSGLLFLNKRTGYGGRRRSYGLVVSTNQQLQVYWLHWNKSIVQVCICTPVGIEGEMHVKMHTERLLYPTERRSSIPGGLP